MESTGKYPPSEFNEVRATLHPCHRARLMAASDWDRIEQVRGLQWAVPGTVYKSRIHGKLAKDVQNYNVDGFRRVP